MISKRIQYATGVVAYDEFNRRVEFIRNDGKYRDTITYVDDAGVCNITIYKENKPVSVKVLKYDPVRRRVTNSPVKAKDYVT